MVEPVAKLGRRDLVRMETVRRKVRAGEKLTAAERATVEKDAEVKAQEAFCRLAAELPLEMAQQMFGVTRLELKHLGTLANVELGKQAVNVEAIVRQLVVIAEDSPRRVVRTLGDVAKHFNVTTDTVKKNWRPGWGKECGRAGAWDLDGIEAWKAANLERAPGANEPASEVNRRKREAEARIKEAEARRKERENRLAEAAVVYREDVEGFISEFLRMVRDTHQRLAEEMGPEFPTKVRRELVDSVEQRCAGILAALHVHASRLVELDDA